MQISKNNRLFLNFLLSVWNLPVILNILKKKKMNLKAYVISKLRTRKDVAR